MTPEDKNLQLFVSSYKVEHLIKLEHLFAWILLSQIEEHISNKYFVN